MKSTRKLAGPFLALSPFILVLAFGAKPEARITSEHKFPTYTQNEERNLEGYRKIILASPALNEYSPIADSRIIGISRIWLSQIKENHLKPLYPAFEEELTESGARQQVVHFWEELSRRLHLIYRKELLAQNYPLAEKDLSRLYAVLDSFKYSDGITILNADAYETQTVRHLIALQPTFSPAVINQFRQVVSKIQCNGTSLKSYANISRNEFAEYEQNQSLVKIGEEEGKPLRKSQLFGSDMDASIAVERNQVYYSKRAENQLQQQVFKFRCNWIALSSNTSQKIVMMTS